MTNNTLYFAAYHYHFEGRSVREWGNVLIDPSKPTMFKQALQQITHVVSRRTGIAYDQQDIILVKLEKR